jgi:tripartite-type tricarboxylate transporter receptor subunit TctC
MEIKMNMKLTLGKIWHQLLLAMLFSSWGITAQAQPFPGKPVTLIVTAPAGGTTDLIARIVAERLNLGQPVIVENRPGASGSVAAGVVARARADGHTLLFASASHAGLRALYSRLSYDPVTDFEPIGAIAQIPIVIAVKADSPYRDIISLVQTARENPGSLNCAGGSGGSSVTNLAFEMLKKELGINIVTIPYQGGGPALAALLSGEINCDSDALPSLMPMIQSGKIRALAVMSARRIPSLPQVPTISETLMPSMNASAWLGVLAPKGTSATVLDKLRNAFTSALSDPATIDRIRASGAEPLNLSGGAFGRFIGDEAQRWEAQIKSLGLKAD